MIKKRIPISNVASRPVDIIQLNNARGSIQHYFHFFLGGLVPLVDHVAQRTGRFAFSIRNDIGPMNRILGELPIRLSRKEGDPTHSLPGYDCYLDADVAPGGLNRMTPEIRGRVLDYFASTSPEEFRTRRYPEILLIQRDTEPFFDSEAARVKSSGSQRRSIANHGELAEALAAEFGTAFENVVLERESIYAQFHLFRNARIIIAQHGAALANLFFGSEGARVVEFAPPWGRGLNMFGNLARQCGLRYSMLPQEENHGRVDPGELLGIIGAA